MKPAATHGSLRAGTIINGFGFALQFACTFLLTPMVVHHLGKAGYGIWILVNSFSGYYGLVNLGLSSALIRYISLHSAKGQTGDLQRVVTTGLAFFAASGVLITGLTLAASGPITSFFEIPAGEAPAFSALVRLLGFATALDFVGVVFTAVLNSHERYLTVGLVNIGRTLLRFATTYVLLRMEFGLYGLGATTLAMSAVLLISNWQLARHYHPEIVFRLTGGSIATLGELLKYGGSTFLMNIVNLARTRIGHVILAKVVGVTAVALFGVASSIIMQFYSMLTTTLGSLTARFVRLDANRRDEEMRMLFRKALFICSVLSFGFGLLVFLFGARFIHLWVGPEFAGAVPALHLLTAAYVLALCQSPGWNVMFGTGKHHFMAVTSVFEVVATLALSLYLARDYGATGIAGATALGMIITKVVVQPIYVTRLIGMSLASYIVPILGPAAVALSLWALAASSGLKAYWMDCSLVAWVFWGALTALVFTGLCLALTARQPFYVNPLPRGLRSARTPA